MYSIVIINDRTIRKAVYARRAKSTLANELMRLTRDGLVKWHLHITDEGRERYAEFED